MSDKFSSINSNHKYKHNNRAVEPDFDLSKEFMTTKAQLLALVNRLEHVEKELMMRKYMTKKPPLERVIYEEALELARLRNWSVGFTLSIMWSRFKSTGDVKEAEAAFVLMQREEERKGKRDPIFTEW